MKVGDFVAVWKRKKLINELIFYGLLVEHIDQGWWNVMDAGGKVSAIHYKRIEVVSEVGKTRP